MTSSKVTHLLTPFNPHEGPIHLNVEVDLIHEGPLWLLEYRVQMSDDNFKLIWPPLTSQERQKNLWEHTCLEAFFMYEDGSYEEWNFSPCGDWNCFSFTGYRSPENLVERPTSEPSIKNPENGLLKVSMEKRPDPILVNLTAVIEVKTNGTKTLHYLAKNHPKAKADFHDKSCFSSLA